MTTVRPMRGYDPPVVELSIVPPSHLVPVGNVPSPHAATSTHEGGRHPVQPTLRVRNPCTGHEEIRPAHFTHHARRHHAHPVAGRRTPYPHDGLITQRPVGSASSTRACDPRAFLSALALLAACSSSPSRGDAGDDPAAGDRGDAAVNSQGDAGDAAVNGRPDAGAPAADGGVVNEPRGCKTGAHAAGFEFVEIATWRDRATAAYSMIHDDICAVGSEGIHQHAVPALNARGLVAGLGPIVAECDAQNRWDEVIAAEAAGHEIVNHSYTHPEITVDNAPREVVEAKAAFDQYLVNPVTFYIFPFDFWTPETVAAVGAAGHIGARAGRRDDNDGIDNPPINAARPGNDLEVEFDVWPRAYSKYVLYHEADILSVHVHHAIARGSWAVREFHSVIPDDEPFEGHGFGPVPLSIYNDHLDFLVHAASVNAVWTANPSTVIRYRRAREACTARVVANTIEFDPSNPECVEFATPLSVIVRSGADVPSVVGLQVGTAVMTRKLGPNTFSVTADPTAGAVALSGCQDPGAVVATGSIPAPPSPADSVCEIETVTGTGEPGQMDNFERPKDQFQVLPNPSQRDGRTGSWSWYPQTADVGMVTDGNNTVLRYAGRNLAAWSGVTLAFLGGSGAGTCYDASAYRGIRFKIRGRVEGGGALANTVIFNIVTAETQSRAFGGDLEGQGGHFQRLIELNPTFQTVSFTWDALNPPTWGDTTSLISVARAKLQALDWGISNEATRFEVFIDDVELF